MTTTISKPKVIVLTCFQSLPFIGKCPTPYMHEDILDPFSLMDRVDHRLHICSKHWVLKIWQVIQQRRVSLKDEMGPGILEKPELKKPSICQVS